MRLPTGLIQRTISGIVTIEVWAQLGIDNSEENRLFEFGRQSPPYPTYRCYRSVPSGDICCASALTATPTTICSEISFNGSNIYLTLILDGNYGWMTMYLNGILVGSAPLPSLTLANTDIFTVGAAINSQQTPIIQTTTAIIDEIRIWAGELTASAVAFRSTLGPDYPVNSTFFHSFSANVV